MASAEPAVPLSIPAGRLESAIAAIGMQGNVTIGMADPTLAAILVRSVHGRMRIAAALHRLLTGTAADFAQIDPQTFRIVRRTSTDRAQPRAIVAPADGTIVVTGSKRAETLADYAGSVAIVSTEAIRPGRFARGSNVLLDLQPVLSATHLGPGRNKLFIRGIADSSFNGPTEATVGQYLGEVRLNYNAPDPDLALYDIAAVEILEGPQGTLYGAGSLGGIIRLVPTAPDLTRSSLAISAGGALTAHGAPSGDGALIANLPIVTGTTALRGVVYGSVDGGYIDDPSRGLRDINRTTTRGGRVTLRFQPSASWTIDLGGVVQNINNRDGQYAERGLPPLQRSSVLGQPFDNDYSLASLTVRHDMGATSLVSTSSAVFHEIKTTYDASPSRAIPVRYDEDNGLTIFTSETRLSRKTSGGGGWVIGVELLHSINRLSRMLGPPGSETRIAGTRNAIDEASIYGEITLPLTQRFFVTGGGRIAYNRSAGEVLDAKGRDEPNRHDVSLLPSIGILWKAGRRLSLYGRYQEGYRPGGLSVQAGSTQRFEADSVATWELGARYGNASDRFHASAAISWAHWEDIQADLIDVAGLPFTANIGSGRIIGLQVQAAWRPTSRLAIDGALFIDDSVLSAPTVAFTGERDASLPNIADTVANLNARYTIPVFGKLAELTASARYVGRSRLGVGTVFDLSQGRTLDAAAGITVPIGRVSMSLDVDNLLDQKGNVFALGNPFGAAGGRQITPLRPRTIRLGATMKF